MKLSLLEERLGYTFHNQTLLKTALTHRSYSSANYERLEFLGDSILNFSTAYILYHRLQKDPEGELSRIRAGLVKQDTLFQIAQQLQISDFLFLGEGELKSGGYQRPSILADVLEAILAAVYLDSGDMRIVQQLVERLLAPFLQDLNQLKNNKDPKSELQELLQGYLRILPQYKILEVSGLAHEQAFDVACCIDELDIQTQGHSSSRRDAEKKAAAQALPMVRKALVNMKTGKPKKIGLSHE